MTDPDLADELRGHMADPFPESVEEGEDYGDDDPVMIGGGHLRMTLTVSAGSRLSALDRSPLSKPPAS